MAFIDADDIALYAPTLELTGGALTAAITSAQAYVESPLGANRPLELTTHREVRIIPSNGRFFLSRLPIESNSISIEVRGGEYFVYDLTFSGNEWRSIDSNDFEIDYDRGEIWMKSTTSAGLYTDYRAITPYRISRPTRKVEQPTARISYRTGFDPSSTDPEVIALKVALCSIVSVRNSDAFKSGQIRFKLDGFYETEYGAGSGLNASSVTPSGNRQPYSVMDEYLSLFKKYRPREFVV